MEKINRFFGMYWPDDRPWWKKLIGFWCFALLWFAGVGVGAFLLSLLARSVCGQIVILVLLVAVMSVAVIKAR